MNNKGFTLVEAVLGFALATVILTGLILIMVNYRDRVDNEGIKNSMTEFKNTITKIVYDDIIAGKYNKIISCGTKCARFEKVDGGSVLLKVVEVAGSNDKGLYLEYDEIKYLLPDSNLNKNDEVYAGVRDFNIQNTDNIYSVWIPFYHTISGYNEAINLTIS